MLMIDRIQQVFIVFALMVISFFIQELPSSNVLQLVLPEWPFLLVLFFSVSPNFTFGIIAAFFIGLLEDVVLGMPVLGLNAGVYAIAAFVIRTLQLRFEHMSLISQALIIALLVFIKLSVIMVFSSIWYSPPSHFWVFLSVPISLLAWPLLNGFFGFFHFKQHN